jgi:hypothetical protein
MNRVAWIAVLAFVLCSCSKYWGSSTSERPALTEPAIGADGAFWDAAAAAQRGDTAAFRIMLSPRFIHESILPQERRDKPETPEDFDRERLRLETQLAPYEPDVQSMLVGYMHAIADLTANRFVEVSKPDNQIAHRDGYKRAMGPNRSSVKVLAWTKAAQGAEEKPDTLKVHFVQDGYRWLIDDLEPNRLKGAFAR